MRVLPKEQQPDDSRAYRTSDFGEKVEIQQQPSPRLLISIVRRIPFQDHMKEDRACEMLEHDAEATCQYFLSIFES